MEIKTYKKKPLPVNAFQWDGEIFLDGPMKGVIHDVYQDFDGKWLGLIDTIEAQLRIQSGVWIVGPGARGEYWPVQDDIFRATYEEVGNDGSR